MKLNKFIQIGAICACVMPFNLQAVQYVLTSGNVFDGASDQAVIYDNLGVKTPLSESGATASLGYFKTINDPSSVSVTSLAGDFETLATSNFSENPGFNGFFAISNTISNVEGNAEAIAGNGLKLYLFLGNETSLGASSHIGLVDTGLVVPDVTGGLNSYSSTADFSKGGFTTLGSIILGATTNDNVIAGSGVTSDGAFELVQVPEPSSTALLGLGGIALLIRRRR